MTKEKANKGDDAEEPSEEYSDISSGDIYNHEEDEGEDDEDDEVGEDNEVGEDDDEVGEDDEADCSGCKEPAGGFFNKYAEAEAAEAAEAAKDRRQSVFLILKRVPKKDNKKIKKVKYNFYKKYNNDEKKYFDLLSAKEQEKVSILEDKLEAKKKTLTVPMRFKILGLDINERTKRSIIFKLECLSRMSSTSGEFHKISNWLGVLNEVPFNKYFKVPVKNTDGNDKICEFLSGIRERMNDRIYGHKEAKEQIIRVLAQLISFPKAYGYIIGIQGAAGIGKTKLIKEGICNALNYPNAFISLSGTDDASFLRGHSYTYEGATYGKICESLIKTGIMNPLLLFDELDKVSDTYKGQEIINTLIHITDPVQNDKFTDRYFEEIDLDISRSMIVFTFNDETLINPILKDRMIVINVKGYNKQEKIVLAKDYLIPEILAQYNLKKGDIIFGDEVIAHIIDNVEGEEGVRNLKRAINNLISWINMMRYVSIDDVMINLPYVVDIKFYDKYCGVSNNNNLKKDVLHSLYL
uniref:ATPase AAA-type core domain-containing protein n=1 Tax=viral metagenome TaxID=1070528 RepID=A0A6C0K8M8_9ZZZZ